MSQLNFRSFALKLQLFGKYCFAPRLIPTLLTLILLPFFLSLGFWQLQRADEKQRILNDFTTRTTLAPLQWSEVQGTLQPFRYRIIALRGRFDNQHNFLLDNKFSQHRLGYQVITPFIISRGPTVLVNRGWIPLGTNRAVLPPIPVVKGEVAIKGFIEIPNDKHFTLGNLVEEDSVWPKRVQFLDIGLLAKLLATPLTPYVVLLAPTNPYGFVREWTPMTIIAPARHIGYAIQWFLFAAILLGLYVGLNIRRI